MAPSFGVAFVRHLPLSRSSLFLFVAGRYCDDTLKRELEAPRSFLCPSAMIGIATPTLILIWLRLLRVCMSGGYPQESAFSWFFPLRVFHNPFD